MYEEAFEQGYDRVRAHSFKRATARIDQRTQTAIHRAKEDPSVIPDELTALDREWDLERAILIPFALMGAVALALGLRRERRFRFPLTGQIAAMLTHALIGWSPQAVVLRRLGFRTRQEIEAERQALLALPVP
jgi:hypothetical protein